MSRKERAIVAAHAAPQDRSVSAAEDHVPDTRPRNTVRRTRRLLRPQLLPAICFFVFVGLVVLAIIGPAIVAYDPLGTDYLNPLAPPSGAHPFGTDDFGRDALSRIIVGARTTLSIALAALLVSGSIGAIIGLVSGYYGGYVDLLSQRFLDIFMSLPSLVLALTIVSLFGSSFVNVVLAISVVFVPRVARVVRSETLLMRAQEYIEAARATGVPTGRILLKHILPNAFSSLIVVVTLNLGLAVLTEASLSYLGFGVPPPEPSWGRMLAGSSQQLAFAAPWLVIFPGAVLALTVFAFNVLGDTARDRLDPRLSEQ